jgi:hypothetical protein
MNSGIIHRAVLLFCLVSWLSSGLPKPLDARTEKPTIVVEDFYRLVRMKQYSEAAELLSSIDKKAIKMINKKAKQVSKAGKKDQPIPTAEAILADMFFLMHDQENKKMAKKGKDGETIMPDKIGFFVPGQFYVVGNYALVFTRETYEIAHDNTGPVRDDPRKLWIDPTNSLSKVRDEAYFKRWWIWDGDHLIMPGCVWLVKERRQWRIDLLSGAVPRKSFTKILRWHFGRNVFEEKKKEKAGKEKKPKKTTKPSASPKKSTP